MTGRRFATPRESEVEAAIPARGLSRQKAPRIQAVLQGDRGPRPRLARTRRPRPCDGVPDRTARVGAQDGGLRSGSSPGTGRRSRSTFMCFGSAEGWGCSGRTFPSRKPTMNCWRWSARPVIRIPHEPDPSRAHSLPTDALPRVRPAPDVSLRPRDRGRNGSRGAPGKAAPQAGSER